MSRVSVNLTDGLRSDLQEACEKSGRTLTAEIEARLRDSLGSVASHNLLLLRIDDGLWSWLTAYVKGIGMVGSRIEDVAIWHIRSGVIKDHDADSYFLAMYRHLPESIQNACRHRWLRLVDRGERSSMDWKK
jgi:hypothetical protein